MATPINVGASHARAAYDQANEAAHDMAHILGVLDASRALGIPVDGASLVAAIEAAQARVVEVRDAAIALMILTGHAG